MKTLLITFLFATAPSFAYAKSDTYRSWTTDGAGNRCYSEMRVRGWPHQGAQCIKQCWSRYNALYLNWNYFSPAGICN